MQKLYIVMLDDCRTAERLSRSTEEKTIFEVASSASVSAAEKTIVELLNITPFGWAKKRKHT